MKVNLIAITIIVSFVNFGCLFDPFNTSHIDLIKMDKPVMLGKVRKIGGAIIQPGAQKLDLDYSRYTANIQPGVGSWITHDEDDATGALKKGNAAQDDLIKVDTVYFRSRFLFFIAYGSCRTVTGIQGGIYEGNSVSQSEHSVKKAGYSGEKP